MKTLKNIILASALILSSFTFSFAGGEDTIAEACTSTELINQIKKEVAFPDMTEEYGYEGTVKVSFEIDADSKIRVISTESSSSLFDIHVKESLDGMEIHPSLNSDCGVYETNIDFKG